MSKIIPSLLQAHLDESVNTTSYLLLIQKNTGFTGVTEKVGIHSLDIPVTYDDGGGAVTYLGTRGLAPSAQDGTADLSVDNMDTQVLLDSSSLDALVVSEVDAGRFDGAAFSLYKVNWRDLAMGHEVVHFGTVGQARIVGNGLAVLFELRGQSQKYKQNVGHRDTKDCPARFGSQPGEQRLFCGFDATTLLVAGAVGSVGAEVNRMFTDASLAQATDFFVPGMVFWTGGRNAGTSNEVDTFASGGVVSLRFDASFPIEAGDTFNIRQDCNKRARDADKGCKHWFPTTWQLRFRGCPDIPTGDQSSLQSPGATTPSKGKTLFGIDVDPAP